MRDHLFRRVYKLRKKFCYLIKKVPKGKNAVTKELSACIEDRFNGFQLEKRLCENERRHLYRPIDIVCKSVSKINQIDNFYFSKSMRNAYRFVSQKKGRVTPSTADQCYACSKFFIDIRIAVVTCLGSCTNSKIKVFKLFLIM